MAKETGQFWKLLKVKIIPCLCYLYSLCYFLFKVVLQSQAGGWWALSVFYGYSHSFSHSTSLIPDLYVPGIVMGMQSFIP